MNSEIRNVEENPERKSVLSRLKCFVTKKNDESNIWKSSFPWQVINRLKKAIRSFFRLFFNEKTENDAESECELK